MESFKSLSILTVLKIGRSPVLHDTDALCNPQETLCNPQQTLCNLQPTLCNPQQMLCNPPQTLCNLQPTLCNPLQTLCNPQQMLCNPPQTLCNLQPTLCNPLQTLCNPQQMLCNPPQTLCNPLQTLCNQQQMLCNPLQTLCNPLQALCNPQQTHLCPLCRPTSCRGRSLVEKRKTSMSLVSTDFVSWSVPCREKKDLDVPCVDRLRVVVGPLSRKERPRCPLCRPTSCRGRSLVEKRKTSMSLVGRQKYARSISVIW